MAPAAEAAVLLLEDEPWGPRAVATLTRCEAAAASRPSEVQVAATKALIGPPPLPENSEWKGRPGSALIEGIADQALACSCAAVAAASVVAVPVEAVVRDVARCVAGVC